jgi:hypothetical protein
LVLLSRFHGPFKDFAAPLAFSIEIACMKKHTSDTETYIIF